MARAAPWLTGSSGLIGISPCSWVKGSSSAPRVALDHQLLGDRHRDLPALRRPQHAAQERFVVDLQPGRQQADVLGRFLGQGRDR